MLRVLVGVLLIVSGSAGVPLRSHFRRHKKKQINPLDSPQKATQADLAEASPPAPVPIACPAKRAIERKPPTGNRYVVVAAAMGYGVLEFQQFIVPLRKVYKGDIVVLTEKTKLPKAVLEFCKKHSVILTEIPHGSRLGVKGNRYTGYANVCSRYDWCFASDFRDAFFQADPFRSLPAKYDLILPEEFIKVKIKTCKWNREWIETCWGTEFLESIWHNSPVCSGTIMGTPAGFCALKTAMLDEMARTSTIAGCKARDQGHLNYLYFADKLGVPTLLEPRGKGIVNTVGYIPLNTITWYLNGEGLVKDMDGKVSAVVHQYDRFPELKRLVARLIIE